MRHGLRRRVARHRAVDPAHAPREVPRRVPPRAAVTHPGRADGVHVPTALERTPARQHRHRRRTGRARALRRVGGQGDALRAHGRIRPDHAGRVEWRAVRRSTASTTTSTARPLECRPNRCRAIYFGGASEAAERIAAEHVDVYLAWGEPPAMVSERVARMRALAAAAGRAARLRHPVPRHRAPDRRRGVGGRATHCGPA